MNILFTRHWSFLAIMFLVLVSLFLVLESADSVLESSFSLLDAKTQFRVVLSCFVIGLLIWVFVFLRHMIRARSTNEAVGGVVISICRFIVVASALAIGALLFYIVMGMLLGALTHSILPGLSALSTVASAIVTIWLIVRFSTLLSAASLGFGKKLGQAWHETKGAGWLLFLPLLITLCLLIVGQTLNLPSGVSAFVGAIVIQLVFLMIVTIYLRVEENAET
jgi:hypothetical protein